MDIFEGLRVELVVDADDLDSVTDDFPLVGVVEGFEVSPVFGPAVVVRHDDFYVERIVRDQFWSVYRQVS